MKGEDTIETSLLPSPFVPKLTCLVSGKVEEDEEAQEELVQHSPLPPSPTFGSVPNPGEQC